MTRRSELSRKTSETDILIRLNLDGTGMTKIATGIGFFDHMLTAFGRHGLFDLEVEAQGDLHIDAHHTVEDVGIVLGQALAHAVGDKRGINRFGQASIPMDEALVDAAIDLSGRSYLGWQVNFERPMLGTMDTQLVEEFFRALTSNGLFTLHLRQLAGTNAHHVAEAAFKAAARALRMAVALDARSAGQIPSTKGSLMLARMLVAVVDYGSGNLASAARGLSLAAEQQGLAADIRITADPELVARANRIVLPGQGAFADCAAGLAAVPGLKEAMLRRVAEGAPFLGICVGMQLMAERGLEFGVTEGSDGSRARSPPCRRATCACPIWAGTSWRSSRSRTRFWPG